VWNVATTNIRGASRAGARASFSSVANSSMRFARFEVFMTAPWYRVFAFWFQERKQEPLQAD
jgi:hypothetical protein